LLIPGRDRSRDQPICNPYNKRLSVGADPNPPRPWRFGIVQAVTLGRAAGAILFVCTALTPQKHDLSLFAYLVAASSDLFDGYLARRLGVVTRIGGALDLFGDKFLTIASVLYAAALDVALFPCCLIVMREVLLASLRAVRVRGEALIPPTRYVGALTVLPIRLTTAILVINPSLVLGGNPDAIFWMIATISTISLGYRLLTNRRRILWSLRADRIIVPPLDRRLFDHERQRCLRDD